MYRRRSNSYVLSQQIRDKISFQNSFYYIVPFGCITFDKYQLWIKTNEYDTKFHKANTCLIYEMQCKDNLIKYEYINTEINSITFSVKNNDKKTMDWVTDKGGKINKYSKDPEFTFNKPSGEILKRSFELFDLQNDESELQPPEGGGFNLRLESRLSC